MKKILGLLAGVILVLVAVSVAFAAQGNNGKAATPPFPQPVEKELQKVIFIRYAPGFEKPSRCDYDGICEKGENAKSCPSDCVSVSPSPEPSSCYDFLSGAKPRWNWLESYYYSDNELRTTSDEATRTWEQGASAEIFGSSYLGNYPWGVYDLKNAISYGNYPEEGVLAVTAIWFRGKNIYEYDILFDTDYFPGKDFDLDTVTLHEFGHAAGLDDLYKSECQEEVMYGYLGIGEKKTTLGPGDILGIQALY